MVDNSVDNGSKISDTERANSCTRRVIPLKDPLSVECVPEKAVLNSTTVDFMKAFR